MPDERVLIVDDEPAIRKFLRVTLTSQSYNIVEAESGQEALSKAATHKPDIIVLDMSVRGAEGDKIAALDAGADDYLTKPFGVGELLARLRAALRRSTQTTSEPVFTSGNLKMDLSRRLITVSGLEVQLTPTEYELLHVLVNHAGKVLTHHYLLREVWGAEYGEEFHMLHVNISNLRRKIEPDPTRPQFIITEPGVGYRLKID
jgi:two-component system KDP operon response regulator KdpE